MKKFVVRTAVVLALVASIGLAAPVAAFASGATTSTTTTTTTTIPFKARAHSLAAYRADRFAINQSFKWAMSAAQAVFQQAKDQATTAVARSTARAAYELALIQAAANRDSALTNLGKPPTH